MAEEIRSACVGCGVKPCMDCKKIVLICDQCGSECKELYLVEGEEMCEECANECAEQVFHDNYSIEEKIELLKL